MHKCRRPNNSFLEKHVLQKYFLCSWNSKKFLHGWKITQGTITIITVVRPLTNTGWLCGQNNSGIIKKMLNMSKVLTVIIHDRIFSSIIWNFLSPYNQAAKIYSHQIYKKYTSRKLQNGTVQCHLPEGIRAGPHGFTG
jgi:hypothetical protein